MRWARGWCGRRGFPRVICRCGCRGHRRPRNHSPALPRAGRGCWSRQAPSVAVRGDRTPFSAAAGGRADHPRRRSAGGRGLRNWLGCPPRHSTPAAAGPVDLRGVCPATVVVRRGHERADRRVGRRNGRLPDPPNAPHGRWRRCARRASRQQRPHRGHGRRLRPGRVRTAIEVVAPILAGPNKPVPVGLTPQDLATNECVAAGVGLDPATPPRR